MHFIPTYVDRTYYSYSGAPQDDETTISISNCAVTTTIRVSWVIGTQCVYNIIRVCNNNNVCRLRRRIRILYNNNNNIK